MQVERLDRHLDFTQANEERRHHANEARHEDKLAGTQPPAEEKKHADHAKKKAENTAELHVPDQPDPVAQVFDFAEVDRVWVGRVAGMEVADRCRYCQKSICVGEHEQRNRGKKQRRSGDVDSHRPMVFHATHFEKTRNAEISICR